MKHLTILINILLIPAFIVAQGRLEGKVMVAGNDDAPDGEGLPGANVVWAGTTVGASANAAGYFTIKKETLLYSFGVYYGYYINVFHFVLIFMWLILKKVFLSEEFQGHL